MCIVLRIANKLTDRSCRTVLRITRASIICFHLHQLAMPVAPRSYFETSREELSFDTSLTVIFQKNIGNSTLECVEKIQFPPGSGFGLMVLQVYRHTVLTRRQV